MNELNLTQAIVEEYKLPRQIANRLADELAVAESLEKHDRAFLGTRHEVSTVLNVEDVAINEVPQVASTADESTLYNLTTSTSDTRLSELLRTPIIAPYADEVIVNMFKYVKMNRATIDVPSLAVSFENSTTSQVAENGEIFSTRLTTSKVSMTAVKYAYKAVFTTEALEDPLDIDVNLVRELLSQDMKNIVKEREQLLAALLLTGTTAGDVWFDTAVPSDWATDHVAEEYEWTLYKAIDEANTYITRQNYTPDFLLMAPEVYSGYVKNLKAFERTTQNLRQQGLQGRYLEEDIYVSNNMTKGVIIVGERGTFGYFGMRIPFMLMSPVYEPTYDRSTYVVRTRFASLITVSNCLARVILYSTQTSEECPVADGAAQTDYYPIRGADASGTITVKHGTADGTVVTTVTEWDSRTETAPVISGDLTISIDLETGAIAVSDDFTVTNNKLFVTYDAKYAM